MLLEERFAESVDAERSPDILLAFKPYRYARSCRSRRLLHRRARVAVELRSPGSHCVLASWTTRLRTISAIETVDIAPTLAALVGVPHPAVTAAASTSTAERRTPVPSIESDQAISKGSAELASDR